jgi:hypothetical protein
MVWRALSEEKSSRENGLHFVVAVQEDKGEAASTRGDEVEHGKRATQWATHGWPGRLGRNLVEGSVGFTLSALARRLRPNSAEWPGWAGWRQA